MDQGTLHTIISNSLPEEKEILGKRLFAEVIEKSFSGEVIDLPKPSGGHAIDIASVLDVVKTTAEFVIAVYGIFEIYKSNRKKLYEDLRSEKAKSKYSHISEEKIDELIDVVKKNSSMDD